MSERSENLSETFILLEEVLRWANCQASLPVVYLGTDTGTFGISPRPWLEIGVHTGGAETRIDLGPHSALVRPGMALVMNGHFGYTGRPVGGPTQTIWWVSFDVSGSSPAPGLADTPLLITRPVRDVEHLADRYGAARRLYRQPQIQPHRDVRLKCQLLLLLADLAESVTAGAHTAPVAYSPCIEAAVDLALAEFTRPDLARADLARTAGLSEVHFGRRFRREVGQTPMQYVAGLRLSRALELLERTRLNIGEVASAVGYGDAFHFSRMFRRATGLSPRAYRTCKHISP